MEYAKFCNVPEVQRVHEFILAAKEGRATRSEIVEKLDAVTVKLDELNSDLAVLQGAAQQMDYLCEHPDNQKSSELIAEYGTEDEISQKYQELEKKRNAWAHMLTQLEELLANHRRFNKTLCFANIRELLRQNPDVKIGQIEKEAGIRLGYMSRLDKEGNTSEPSIEFIITAANLLKVSLDTLVSVNLAGLTPTEQYLVLFFDKLKSDTLADKLDWIRESAFYLNRIEPDYNGFVDHPLFGQETFYEETECEYPQEVTRIVFSSKTFGPKTYIAGDCFNLRLKNGTTLYLMDIEKSVHRTNDPSAYAKEAWVYVPGKGASLLVASQDNTPVAPLLDSLFAIVKERMEHPKINKDILHAINAFMLDDLEDDPCDDLPF